MIMLKTCFIIGIALSHGSIGCSVDLPQDYEQRKTERDGVDLPQDLQIVVLSSKKSRQVIVVLGSCLGAFFGVVLMVVALCRFFHGKDEELDEIYLDQVPGMPSRFSYEDLKMMTNDFTIKLGDGGFGSVFEGTLSNGTKVAVKCLYGLGHVKKSFLAEVETISSIHHVNLVRLIGFCAGDNPSWKSLLRC